MHSVGQANFDWIVKEVADLAIAQAKAAPHVPALRGSAFLGAGSAFARGVGKKPAVKKHARAARIKPKKT
jgi:hypothetical protein